MELIRKLDMRVECGRRRRYALFLCPECKNIVEKRYTNGMRDEKCGCVKKSMKHNNTGKRMYRSWAQIIQRCTNPNNDRYHRYGGRGITVCDEWIDYKIFKKWALENGYQDHLFIDRINNDDGYYPENCHYVSSAQNSRNTRRSVLTWPKVNLIRSLCGNNVYSQKELAEMFNVTAPTISGIMRFKIWKP